MVNKDKEGKTGERKSSSREDSKRGNSRRGPSTARTRGFDKDAWKPKTSLGIKVKSGEIDNIDYILDNRLKILEGGIVDILMPNLTTDLLLVGQSKGKFGGQNKVPRLANHREYVDDLIDYLNK